MRVLILSSLFAFASTGAIAGSIETITSRTEKGPSELTVTCQGCTMVPVAPESSKAAHKIWQPSDAKVEIKEINGTKKRFSNEAWFGGSPVVFVTKAPGEITIDAAANQPLPGVDPSEKTSALNTINDAKPVQAAVETETAKPAKTADAAAPSPVSNLVDSIHMHKAPAIPRLHPGVATSLDTNDMQLRTE